jgi:hypothetical protein
MKHLIIAICTMISLSACIGQEEDLHECGSYVPASGPEPQPFFCNQAEAECCYIRREHFVLPFCCEHGNTCYPDGRCE